MVSSRHSLKRTLLLSTFAALSLFSATGLAQDNTSGGDAQTSASQAASTNDATTSAAQPSRTTAATAVISNTGAVATTEESITAPRITGTSDTTGDVLTGFPSLTNQPIVTTYPPASVPPTNNAPYMHRSSAPQGTVFIAVGSILGAFGLGILIWRGIIAYLLHRSVARAANAQYVANDKQSFPAPPAQFYKYTDRESTPSLVPNGGRGVRRTQRGPIPSATPSQSNLFFSPTAAGGGNSNTNNNNNSATNRDSRFLPSGFYAAATSSPSPAHGHSISLTNLRPESRGQYGSRNNLRESTPPESPLYGARRDFSTSSVNLSAAPGNGQRAPSAYLEDLLDENPNAFPPSQMRPGSRNANNSPGGRF